MDSTPDGYAYHVTGHWAVADIVSDGKMIPFKPSHGSDQNVWPDGGLEKRIYFARTYDETLKFFNPDLGRMTVLRVRIDKVPLCDEGGGLDLFSCKPVPVSAIEYQTPAGDWMPLSGYRSGLSESFCGKNNIVAVPSLRSILRLDEASKQSLINLGYPQSVSSVLLEMFGKNAALIARWFMEYSLFGRKPTDDWFYTQRPTSLFDRDELAVYSKLADVLQTGDMTAYNQAKEDLGLYVDPNEVIDFDRYKQLARSGLQKVLTSNTFFRHTIIKDMLSGQLKDLKPYAKLEFNTANKAYEERKMFAAGDVPAGMGHVLKRYPNGMMWINAGDKCQLVAGDMSNCGSTGVMSLDKNSSMFVLYDANRKAHAIFALSPNQGNRVSGVEGRASTEMKPEYNDYVLDAVKELDGWLDLYGSGNLNHPLKLRYMLGDSLIGIRRINSEGGGENYELKVRSADGKEVVVYTNGFSVFVPDAPMPREYVETVTGLSGQEENAAKLLGLDWSGRLHNRLPRILTWMHELGIQAPEAKGQ